MRSLAPQEMLLVGRLLVRIARTDHHPFDAELHHLVEEAAHPVRIAALEERRVGRYPEASGERCADCLHGDVVDALARHGAIVFRARTVHVDAEAEIFARLELVELALEKERIRAEIDEPAAVDESARDVGDLRVQQRFAAGDADHRRTAFVGCVDALLDGEVLLQDRDGVLDLAAAGAGQVAAKERLQHEHERIALAPTEALLQHVAAYRHHLRRRNSHGTSLLVLRAVLPLRRTRAIMQAFVIDGFRRSATDARKMRSDSLGKHRLVV